MMLQAAIQAVSSTEKYPIDLDPCFCAWIASAFRQELAQEALVLA